MLQEDNISTALRGRSSFSWSCSLRRLQEVSLFFWEREGSVSEGRNEHQPCHLKCVLEEIPLVLDLRLQSCLMSWTRGSLDGKPPRASPSAYRSGAAPAYSLGVSLARGPAQEMWGTRCSWRCYHCSLTFVPSCCLSLELKLVFGSSRRSRIVGLARSPWHAPGLSDWPKAPDVLQTARSPLTGTASCTTLSTLNSNSLSWRGLRSGAEKSWR